MIINIFKDITLYQKLARCNASILEGSKKFHYVQEGEDYDFANLRISGWFNPVNVRNLGLSRTYPHMCPIQYKEEYNLYCHHSNYLTLFLMDKLYSTRKDVLIEDVGSGMGFFFIYAKEMGFTNFSAVDNFSQLPQNAFEITMQGAGINYKLNQLDLKPVISNNVGMNIYPVRQVSDELELICCYTNRSLEERLFKEYSPKYKFLCRDEDDTCVAFCRNDLYDSYAEKIKN